MTHQFKVGDKVWVYDRAKPFVLRETTIDGETSRSWIVDAGTYSERKLPKKDFDGMMFNEQQKSDYEWIHNHSWRVAKLVDRCRDADKLRQIAAIVGYVEETK